MIEATIQTTWNGEPVGPRCTPIHISLKKGEDGLIMEVKAPYFRDPPPPGSAGKPFWELWDYEVVEAFFLNDKDQYLEVELGPHGHHLTLLLNGRRKISRHSLSLDVSTEIVGNTWTAKALIPREYFPPQVTKWNAFAIHGTGTNRTYEALYPVDDKIPQPDFHSLEYFREIDLRPLLPEHHKVSQTWQDISAQQ